MTKIKIKDSLYLVKNSEDIYSAIFTATRKIKKFKVDGLVKKTLSSLESPLEENILYEKLKDFPKEKVDLCLSSLEKFGLVRRYNEENVDDRYSKQISFIDELTESWEETLFLHNRLRNSKISVFGVGGIGTWIVNGLYQMGVNEIKITDPDTVSKSNLNRQLFFDSKDIGKYKVDVIKEKLTDANILTYKKKVSENESLDELIEGSTFLVNCADSPSVSKTTQIIDSYARPREIPYCVAGGYNMHLGMIGPIIVPGQTKSFDEFLEIQKKEDPLKNLEVIKEIENPGNLGPIAGAVANMQLMEIFKHIIGKGSHNYNKFFEIDFMDFDVSLREF